MTVSTTGTPRDVCQRPVTDLSSCANCGRPIGWQPQVAVFVHLPTGLHQCHPGTPDLSVATPTKSED